MSTIKTNAIQTTAGKPILNSTGSILQVVSSSLTTAASTTSTSYTSTGLSATITPSSTSNKILVSVTGHGSHSEANGNQCMFRMVRNVPSANTVVDNQATSPYLSNTYGQTAAIVEGARSRWPVCFDLYDSPTSTSAITYTLNWLTTGGTGYLGRWGTDANWYQATSLVLMEISA